MEHIYHEAGAVLSVLESTDPVQSAGEGMSLAAALHATKLARPCIAPNSGFMMQLVLFSRQLGIDCTMLQYVLNFASGDAAGLAVAGRGLLEYKPVGQEDERNECTETVF